MKLLTPTKPTLAARLRTSPPAPAAKKAVVALVQRVSIARSFHVANVNASTVRSLIVTNFDRASVLMTDESPVYYRLGKEFPNHYAVNHSAKEYVTTGGCKHCNTAENFFSIFKRGVIGTYHHISEAHISGCRILKEVSNHEALCRIGPVDGKHAGRHR